MHCIRYAVDMAKSDATLGKVAVSSATGHLQTTYVGSTVYHPITIPLYNPHNYTGPHHTRLS